MRHLALALLVMSGCSVASVRRPDEHPTPGQRVECTHTKALPTIDIIVALAAGVALGLVTEDLLDRRNDPLNFGAALIATAAIYTVGFGTSAAYGIHFIRKCDDLAKP